MFSVVLLAYLIGVAVHVKAADFEVNIQSNCPESMQLLQNNVYEGIDMIPGRVGVELGEFDPDVFVFSLSTTGTHVGFNMAVSQQIQAFRPQGCTPAY
jgi:1-aminocyclopropane-1-carboxylate deaminase/D-cysteine desulfhydrase-like pyridoxal-dependent ACC family enzyme